MAAHELVNAGQRVLMLERGGWVARGPDNWGARGAGLVTPHYTMESPYRVDAGGRRYEAGSWQCVGGQSVFYGGASFRFRERDFEPDLRERADDAMYAAKETGGGVHAWRPAPDVVPRTPERAPFDPAVPAD